MDRRLKNIMMIVIVSFLFTAILVLVVMNEYQEKKQADHIKMLEQEAKVYEKEIIEIKTELSRMESDLEKIDDVCQVSFCFQVQEESDIEWIEENFSNYSWPITIVIHVDEENKENIVQKISESELEMELMFSGMSDYEENRDVVQELKELAKQYGVKLASMWFFENGEYTEENVRLLKNDGRKGFTQLTNYSIYIGSGVTKDGMFYVEHVPVKEGENKVHESIDLAVKQKKSLILSFDVPELKETKDYETILKNVIEEVNIYHDDDKIILGLTENYFFLNALKELTLQEKQEAYNKYEEKQKKKIEELEKKVGEIYKDWKI